MSLQACGAPTRVFSLMSPVPEIGKNCNTMLHTLVPNSDVFAFQIPRVLNQEGGKMMAMPMAQCKELSFLSKCKQRVPKVLDVVFRFDRSGESSYHHCFKIK